MKTKNFRKPKVKPRAYQWLDVFSSSFNRFLQLKYFFFLYKETYFQQL